MSEEGKVYQRSYDWKRDVPYDGAKNLRCKYNIKANSALPGKASGYVYVELEQYGFDEDVFVIIQPSGQFANYNSASSTTTQVYKSRFGTKFYIPADRDILLMFAPVRNIGD